MGSTSHGQIGHKHNVGGCILVDKTNYQVIKIDTDLMEYVPKKLAKKEICKTIKHIDHGVNSLKPFTPADKKAISNTHNDTTISEDFCGTTSSTSTFVD